ncbi:hypothetical protein EOPP23_07335 [Endozoicomonas sp. OPT23]|uniref:FTR1 family iron permease n=1 Tax=Endozoicomonas sp. OPT23 TaxID=2072845 RepID=UPI00129B15AB|nr:FTR1 family protein [Endozoicomonas sp. OPT23]MRI32795.1 hypothetical protein [Endozoicomonas sp. OPT23]
MFASFLITFREGLEAFLLVGIALSYLARLNASRHNKFIYLGVGAGMLLSLVIAFVFQVIIDQFSSEHYRNLLMAGILIFATAVLSYMAIWMQGQAKAQVGRMQDSIKEHVTSGNLFGLVFLSFLAVLREGFETILFFSALVYSGQGVTLEGGLIGGLLGLIASVVLVWALLKSTKKVSLTPFFRWTSLLIIIIAAGLLSSAINMLQAAEYLPVFQTSVFDISHILDDRGTFGTFLRALFGYNASPNLLPLIVWAGYLGLFIYFWNKGYAQSSSPSSKNSSGANQA